MCGEVVLDFREAVFVRPEVLVHATNACAKMRLLAGPDVTVVDHGSGWFCDRSVHHEAGGGGPVIHVVGHSVFGDLILERV